MPPPLGLFPPTERALPLKLRRRLSHPASDVPYAYSDASASASSSPVASSALLESSEPNSPTDYPHIRSASSPRRDYYYASPHIDHPDTDLFSWSIQSKRPLPDSTSPPSTASSYPPLSPVLSASHLSSSFSRPSYYHLPIRSNPSSSYTSDRPHLSSDDGDFDADLSEDETDSYFASPSHRRRISFSTSCERDRPINRPPPPTRPLVQRIFAPTKNLSDHRSSDVPPTNRAHVSRHSRPVSPVSSRATSLSHRSSSPQTLRYSRDVSHFSHAEEVPSSPTTVFPSSPLTVGRAKSAAFDLTDPAPVTSSPLPPSSPLLPSSPISSATAVDLDRASPLPDSSPLIPEVQVSAENDGPHSDQVVHTSTPLPVYEPSPAPRAVRSTSLLAILNPAPEPTPRATSLGLVVESPRLSGLDLTPRSRLATPAAESVPVPERPITPPTCAPDQSPFINILPTPEALPRLASSTPSSPLSTPATPLFLHHPGQVDEDEEMHSVLSSPLSTVSFFKDDKVAEGGNEPLVKKPVKKRKVDDGEVAKKKRGKGKKVVSPEFVQESDEEEVVPKKTKKLGVGKAKGKGKEKRSPRVVYSDLESGGEEEDVLPSLPKSVPTTSDAEPEREERKPKQRGRKRKVPKEEHEPEPATKKRKKSRSVAAPSDNEQDASGPSRPGRKRKRPLLLPTAAAKTQLPSLPSTPSKTFTPAQLSEKLAALQARSPIDVKEMQGMLIEALGSARASSLAVESLWTTLCRARPGLEDMVLKRKVDGSGDEVEMAEEEFTLGKKEWLGIVQDVLEYGRLSTGVFGRVESSFKDDHAQHAALPPHYFYVPESDPDPDRATIIKSMMPRPAKRNETKKYKQYYWKPLGKVSRWDSEDAM